MTVPSIMKVSVSILTYNRADILKELLTSLSSLTYSPIETIVIDNHSGDHTRDIVERGFPQVRYFRTQENVGVAARNLGLKMASGDIVVTLDDDIVVEEGFDLQALINIFNSHPDVGAVCFRILDHNTGEVCNWCHHYEKKTYSNREFVTDEITEGAVAFRKAALDVAGLYPTNFFISHEGPDLLCRMLENGYKTIYSPRICVRHRTHKGGREKWRRYYYDTRNQIWLVARNYPLPFGLRYLMRGLSAMLFYAIRDGFFKYWLVGIMHGFRELPNVLQERKPISRETLNTLKKIASNRPGLMHMINQRVFKRGISL